MVSFRPAITSEAKPLIGLYSESGCGKTLGALLLAKGFSGDMSKVGMIETESGRGEMYADDPVVGGYQVLPIRDNFSPKSYGEAIVEAGKAGLTVLIIDSGSHEWEGAGGVLSMAAKNQEDGKKGPLVWQIPKLDHQREFMLRLLQTPVSLVILCMRAKYPMKEEIVKGAKTWTRSTVLEPKQSDDILFEMMVHGWIDQEHNLHVTKYSKETFKQIFQNGKPITVDTGKRLSEWAKGGVMNPTTGEIIDPGANQEATDPLNDLPSPFYAYFQESDEKKRELINSYISTIKATRENIIEKANKNIEGFRQKFDEWVNS
jgi:hypothetical protein